MGAILKQMAEMGFRPRVFAPRILYFDTELREILIKRRDLGVEYPFSFKPSFVTHRIAEYYKQAGIKNANLHTLRKTFGSLILQHNKEADADIYKVSELLGHSTIKTTEKHYVNLLDENYRAPIRWLDKFIKRPTKEKA